MYITPVSPIHLDTIGRPLSMIQAAGQQVKAAHGGRLPGMGKRRHR